MARVKNLAAKTAKKWFVRIFVSFLTAFVVLTVSGLFAMTIFTVPDKPRDEIIAKYTDDESIFLPAPQRKTIHVKDEGQADGPVLVLIHGSNASLHSWDMWTQILKNRYRVIRLDLPGHGVTGPIPSDDYTIAAMADTVRDVLRLMKIDKAILVGSSMGGAVSLRLTLDQPDMVQGLILIGSSGLKFDQNDTPPLAFRLMNMPLISNLTRYITPYNLIRSTAQDAYGEGYPVSSQMVDRYYELLLYAGNRRASALRIQQQAQEEALDVRLANIEKPTLLLWGEEDSFVPVKYGRRMNAYILTSTLVTYPNVGHLPMETEPLITADAADKFIREEILKTSPKSDSSTAAK